ncbi:hypothetical protein [Nocardia farcinica]|uniref:hypothetical protein n=1 Tax=Nocardia farcinica TaxID=37329 RepID=UPI001894F494|nr:hypothetical protein [Nocardia farcinica]MBF6270985.1 hypothetical protein [Nocardia farcinica]MCZ9329324.1 hypothetical protein [Nocardia farcinica]
MILTSECFIAVYGTLRRHPWINLDQPGEDAYSLFNKYAEALNWSDSAARKVGEAARPRGYTGVLWGMNDAGGVWRSGESSCDDHVLWVQTSLAQPNEQPWIPIAQLNLCSEKTLQRVGALSLTGVQMMFSLGYEFIHQPHTWGVFSMSDPRARTNLRVEIEGSDDDTFIGRANDIIFELNSSCEITGLMFDEAVITDSSDYLLDEPPEMRRNAWLGDSTGRIETRVVVPELSFDMSSYIITQLARSSQVVGLSNPVLITIRREDGLAEPMRSPELQN